MHPRYQRVRSHMISKNILLKRVPQRKIRQRKSRACTIEHLVVVKCARQIIQCSRGAHYFPPEGNNRVLQSFPRIGYQGVAMKKCGTQPWHRKIRRTHWLRRILVATRRCRVSIILQARRVAGSSDSGAEVLSIIPFVWYLHFGDGTSNALIRLNSLQPFPPNNLGGN